jgi:hypothetical protein
MYRLNALKSVRWLMLAAVTSWIAACHKWVPLDPLASGLEAQAALSAADRSELQFHMVDGTVKKGKLVEFAGDSVTIGSSAGVPGVVQLEAVSSAAAREWNGTGTAILVGGGVLLGILIGASLATPFP